MKYTGERPTFDNIDAIESSRLRYHSILPFCDNLSVRSILDMGCGVGHGTDYLRQQTTKLVTGYDICEEAIEEAKQRYNSTNFISGLSCNFLNFDIVTMVEFIEHLEVNEALNLLKDIAKNKKAIAMTTPNGDTFPYHPTPDKYIGFHKWHFTLNELQALKDVFEFVEVYGHLYDPQIQRFTSYVVYAK